MLAQNFKTAADLGISEVEVDALIKVLGMLERGEIPHSHFRMRIFRDLIEEPSCGTIGCLCGWANFISSNQAFPEVGKSAWRAAGLLEGRLPLEALRLFAITSDHDCGDRDMDSLLNRVRRKAGTNQAATALRSYLTTGDANWAEALAS